MKQVSKKKMQAGMNKDLGNKIPVAGNKNNPPTPYGYVAKTASDMSRKLGLSPKTYIGKLRVCMENDDVIIMDSGTEETVLGKAFKTLSLSRNETTKLTPYGRKIPKTYQMGNGISTILDLMGRPIALLQVNHAAIDQDRRESLLNMDHVNLNGKAIYTPKSDPLSLSILSDIKGEWECPLYFDGSNEFLRVRYPRNVELKQLPKYVVTSSAAIRPDKALLDALEKSIKKEKKNKKKKAMGKKTRRMAKTVRRISDKEFLHEWKFRLATQDSNLVEKTFQSTTQLVPSIQAENSVYPKAVQKTRFPFFRPRYLDEDCSMDPVEIKIDGKKVYMMVFMYHTSKFAVAYKMTSKNGTVEVIKRLFTEYGVPTKLIADGDTCGVKYEQVKKLLTTYFCKWGATEPHNQQQNKVERMIRNIKERMRWIKSVSRSPKRRDDYLLRYICTLWNHTANRTLRGKTPVQRMTGEMPDLSWCRFKWWDQVWYLEQSDKVAFPGTRMLPGRFLGLDETTGDEHTYFILTAPDEATERQVVISRRIVCPRAPGERAYAENIMHESDRFFPADLLNPWRPRGRPQEVTEEPSACTEDQDLGGE